MATKKAKKVKVQRRDLRTMVSQVRKAIREFGDNAEINQHFNLGNIDLHTTAHASGSIRFSERFCVTIWSRAQLTYPHGWLAGPKKVIEYGGNVTVRRPHRKQRDWMIATTEEKKDAMSVVGSLRRELRCLKTVLREVEKIV
jgi:hypothetical protein